MPDIPIEKAQIIWNLDPADAKPGDAPVVVIGIPGNDDNRYISSWGACNGDFASAPDEQKVSMLFKQFVHLCVNEEIAAGDVHEAFMHIPEYRRALADFGALDPDLV